MTWYHIMKEDYVREFREYSEAELSGGWFSVFLLVFLLELSKIYNFYYFFRQSFFSLNKQLAEHVEQWKTGGDALWIVFLKIAWNHGKYFVLIWIFAVNPSVETMYQWFFCAYTGVRNGFLLLFFLMNRGLKGIFLYGVSLFPQALVFLPLYLCCFAWVQKNRHQRNERWMPVLFLLFFLSACYLEAKCNLPLMERFL